MKDVLAGQCGQCEDAPSPKLSSAVGQPCRLDRDGNDGNRLKPRGLLVIPGLNDKDTSMLVRLQGFYTKHRLQKTTLPRKTREGVDVHRSSRTACQECHTIRVDQPLTCVRLVRSICTLNALVITTQTFC